MTRIRPVDLPEIRADIMAWLDGATAAQLWFKMAAAGHFNWLRGEADTDLSEAGSVMRGVEIVRLQAAELFYVTADMVDLSVIAARSIPDFSLALEDLPAPSGLMTFERPAGTISVGEQELGITAVSWGPMPGHPDVLLGAAYLDRDEAAPVFARLAPNRRVGESEPQLVYANGSEFTWTFGHNHGASLDSSTFMADLGPRLKAAWLLMQQPVVSTSQVHLTRPFRRRLQARGHEPAAVRLVELRRSKATDGTDAASTDRSYQHRWIVRGHWRQQWYPGRKVHRPVWIAPHVKGPDEAPLLGGEKVHIWKR